MEKFNSLITKRARAPWLFWKLQFLNIKVLFRVIDASITAASSLPLFDLKSVSAKIYINFYSKSRNGPTPIYSFTVNKAGWVNWKACGPRNEECPWVKGRTPPDYRALKKADRVCFDWDCRGEWGAVISEVGVFVIKFNILRENGSSSKLAVIIYIHR